MNILIAPNSMKGSLSAFDFAGTMEKAFRDCSPEFSIRKVAVADGGDFTGEVLCRALGAAEVRLKVRDPLGWEVPSKYAVTGKTAIIEMADASGMKLLAPADLDPLKSSSYGTGQLLKHAINNGCSEILLGVGGSATVDGGSGMLEALGAQFFDKNNHPVAGNGRNLLRIRRIQRPRFPGKISVKVISDVKNPLLGENGAAKVFAPQKGASPGMVERLEKGLAHWGKLLERESQKELATLQGAGAAGGVALPLVAFFDAELVAGGPFILSQLHFGEHVKWADWVITGEGKLDAQTLNDKAPAVVARAAREAGKPVLAVGGILEQEASPAFDGMFCFLNGPVSPGKSIKEAQAYLYRFSFELARLLKASRKTGNAPRK